jgi:hypothetical protein
MHGRSTKQRRAAERRRRCETDLRDLLHNTLARLMYFDRLKRVNWRLVANARGRWSPWRSVWR